MSARGSYRLEDQVGFIIRKVSQSHSSIFGTHMIAGLTPTQWAALVKIGESGFITQNLLGRETAMDVATIKGVVERLKIRKLVTVKPDPNDLRRRVIALTRLGHQHLEKGVEKAKLITRETLRNLTPAEQRQLHTLLLKLC